MGEMFCYCQEVSSYAISHLLNWCHFFSFALSSDQISYPLWPKVSIVWNFHIAIKENKLEIETPYLQKSSSVAIKFWRSPEWVFQTSQNRSISQKCHINRSCDQFNLSKNGLVFLDGGGDGMYFPPIKEENLKSMLHSKKMQANKSKRNSRKSCGTNNFDA